MIGGYVDFLTNFNVIGLAIGFIIGANLKDIANAMISDLIMPFINPVLEKMAGDNGFVYEMPGGIKFNYRHWAITFGMLSQDAPILGTRYSIQVSLNY